MMGVFLHSYKQKNGPADSCHKMFLVRSLLPGMYGPCNRTGQLLFFIKSSAPALMQELNEY